VKASVAAATLGILAITAASSASGQVQEGREIARQVCSACHDVGANQMFPPVLKEPAPGFQAIADRPGVTAQTLNRFVGHTHWDERTLPMTMPDTMLTAEQRGAVVSYILSLRHAPKRPS
jgi:mono/diheme cytochrome c family protein